MGVLHPLMLESLRNKGILRVHVLQLHGLYRLDKAEVDLRLEPTYIDHDHEKHIV